MPLAKAISLFSGMGGDTLGLEEAGFEVVYFSENNKTAIASHLENFPDSQLLEVPEGGRDPSNICNIPDSSFNQFQDNINIDLIFAGFPCQGFSQGGKKLANDPRNTMFREFVRVASLVKPSYIIGENVPGLLTRKTESGQLYIDVIVSEFERIGYNVKYQVCLAVHYGVPQQRKRLIIVGIRKDLGLTYQFPEGPTLTSPMNLSNIVRFNMKGAIKITEEDFDMASLPEECLMTDMDNDEEEDTPNIHPYLRLKTKTRDSVYCGITHRSLLSFGKRGSPIHSEIIDIRNPSKTIICTYDHQPRLYVPLKNKNGYFLRCLLPDELKMIQGFPEDFTVCGNTKGQITQIGNAVPPPLIKAIVEALPIV